jgi:hypothetical protein
MIGERRCQAVNLTSHLEEELACLARGDDQAWCDRLTSCLRSLDGGEYRITAIGECRPDGPVGEQERRSTLGLTGKELVPEGLVHLDDVAIGQHRLHESPINRHPPDLER